MPTIISVFQSFIMFLAVVGDNADFIIINIISPNSKQRRLVLIDVLFVFNLLLLLDFGFFLD